MKFFWARQTCAMAIHLLLEETGAKYESQQISFANDEQNSPAYLAINPKGKVPAMQLDDGSTLTELPAIAFHIALSFPKAHLLPDDAMGQVRALEAMDYAVATMHMRGFARIFKPENYCTNGDPELARKQGLEIIENGFQLYEKQLAGCDWVLGDRFSVADATLFMLEWWYARRAGYALNPNVDCHFQRMLQRPSVQAMLRNEDLLATA